MAVIEGSNTLMARPLDVYVGEIDANGCQPWLGDVPDCPRYRGRDACRVLWADVNGYPPRDHVSVMTCTSSHCVAVGHMTWVSASSLDAHTGLDAYIGSVDEHGCQHWQGELEKGNPKHAGIGVGRIVWAKAHGEIPNDHRIRHGCGNRTCVALAHLVCAPIEQNVVEAQHRSLAFRKLTTRPRQLGFVQDSLKRAIRPN